MHYDTHHGTNEISPLVLCTHVRVKISVKPSIFCSSGTVLNTLHPFSADFLILFFTEAIFYCGVAVFLFLMHSLCSPGKNVPATSSYEMLTSQIGYRISSVAVLVLSLIIPMVTMGFVWPWTGPAASATLAPYLVGIVVQFAFEQYAKYTKSPSWPAIPVVFQVKYVLLALKYICSLTF